jgi:hypothetical protein
MQALRNAGKLQRLPTVFMENTANGLVSLVFRCSTLWLKLNGEPFPAIMPAEPLGQWPELQAIEHLQVAPRFRAFQVGNVFPEPVHPGQGHHAFGIAFPGVALFQRRLPADVLPVKRIVVALFETRQALRRCSP